MIYEKFTEEQTDILTWLTIVYYGSGDVKDIWDDDEKLAQFKKAFDLSDSENHICQKLDELEDIYSDYENLTLKKIPVR